MINFNYVNFRSTIADQRKRLREMIGRVDKEVFEDVRDVYLPTLVQDINESTPIASGTMLDSVQYKINHNKNKMISLTVSVKSYHRGYNYAYIQHENVSYSHDHGTHHFISAPFERMISDIAGDYGLSYTPPAMSKNVFGDGNTYETWSEGVERDNT